MCCFPAAAAASCALSYRVNPLEANQILEAFALVSGLLCVWLLARQNILTFPLGIAYAIVTVYLMLQQQLLASALISVYYVAANAYGWWHWTHGASAGQTALPVARTPAIAWWVMGVVCIAGTALLMPIMVSMGAELALWDSLANVLSFAAMWMAARKYVENWIVWFVVDVILCMVYYQQGLYGYLLLYAVYLVMAVIGWRSWRASMAGSSL